MSEGMLPVDGAGGPRPDDNAAWLGPDLSEDAWIRVLTGNEVAEISSALGAFRRSGRALKDMRKDDFPLPTLSAQLSETREALENGPGLRLFRGFPVRDFSDSDLRTIYWGIGRHIGTAVSQSSRGDVIGDVRDIGTDIKSRVGRGYTSRAELDFHCDSADVTGLFCLHVAKSGGRSFAVSSLAVHDEIARRRPDLLKVLYAPFWWSRQGQELPGEPPCYQQPVYGMRDGRFTSRYIRAQILNAERFEGMPALQPEQREAMAILDEIAHDPAFYLSFQLEPGDMWFVNNHVVYHRRTEFEDWDEPERKRHLLRMWLSVPNSRAMPEGFSAIYRNRDAGAVRGGFPGHVEELIFSTLPVG